MAAPAEFDITGVPELTRLLNELPDKIQSRVLKKAIRFAGRKVVKSQRTGIARHNKSKMLQKSIGTTLKTYKRSGNTVLIVGPRKGFVAENGEPAGTYGTGIEKGWRNRVPDPFMRRSFEAGKATVVPDFQFAIGNGIEKEAAKLAVKHGTLKRK